MNAKITKEKRSHSKIKYACYRLFTFIILNQQNSLILQIILTLFQTLQVISFAFESKYFKFWKNETLTKHLSHFLKYSRIAPFFLGNFKLYIIGFTLSACIFIIYTVIVIYASIALISPHSKRKLSFLFSLINGTYNVFLYLLFTPMFCFFISPLNCIDGVFAFASDFQCYSTTHYVVLVIGIFFALCLFVFVLICYSIGYEQIYNKYNLSSKQSSQADIMLLIGKTIISICHIIFFDDISFIVLYLIVGITIAIVYIQNANLYNEQMNKLNLSLSLIIALNAISLFIARITYHTELNGCLLMFLGGIPVILITIWCYYEGIVELNITNKYSNAKEGYIVIVKLLDIINDVSQNDRKARILLESYVYNYELSCTINNCPLSQYNIQISQGNFNVYSLLYQHINVRYKKLLRLFPTDPFIKLMYAYFLYNSLNKTNLALHQLSTANNQRLSLDEDFLAYRLNIMFDKENSHLFESPDNLSYANLFQKFKTQITKISSLYMSFWTTLYLTHQDSREDLTKLNDCGSAIEKTKNEIDNTFNELQSIKSQDIIVLRYYSDYLNEIMNERDKAQIIKAKIKEIKDSQTEDYTKDIIDIDFQNVSSDELQYIIVTTGNEDFGIMLNVSLGLCVETGYTRNELMGKHLNMLVPELMRSHHTELLRKKYADFFQKEIDTKNNTKKQYRTFLSFYLNKAHFMVPSIFSPGIINTETNDTFFITKVSHVQSNYVYTHNQQNKKECYVFINHNYIIQNITVEAMKLLAISNEEVSKRQISLFIGNYIADYRQRMFDRKNEQELKIRWVKKYKDINMNYEFMCINTPLIMNGCYIGHYLHFIIHDMRFANASNNTLGLNHNFVPVSVPNERFVYDVDKNTFAIYNNNNSNEHTMNNNNNDDDGKENDDANNKKTLIEKLKEKALNHLKHIKHGVSTENESNDNNTSKTNSNDNDDDNDEEEENEDTSEYESTENYLNNNNNHRTSFSVSSGYDNNEHNTLNNHNSKFKQNSIDLALHILKKQDELAHFNKHINNDEYSGYYIVKTQKIKYLIYNFETMRYDEQTNPEHYTNFVQRRLKELSEPQIMRQQSKNNKKSKTEYKTIENVLYNNVNKQNENKIIKQIQYSLEKYEAHGSMLKLRITSFIVFLCLLGEGIFLMMYYKRVYASLNENCSLIHDSYKLLMNCAYSIFYTREMILLAIPEYDITYQNKDLYYDDTLNALKELATQSQNFTDKILTASASLSKEHELSLYNSTFQMSMVSDSLHTFTFNLTLNAALSQTLSAVFILSYMKTNELIPLSKATFFSLNNNMNAIYDGLVHQAYIFSSELTRVSDIHMKILIIAIVVFAVIGVVSAYLISEFYFHVVNTKNDYLEVFYEINLDIIRLSMERCENFNQKFQFIDDNNIKRNVSETKSADDHTDNESIDELLLNSQQLNVASTASANDKDNNATSSSSKRNSLTNNTHYHHHHHKKINNNTTFNIITRVVVLLCLEISTIVSTIIISITNNSLKYFTTNINAYCAIGDINIKYLMLFNGVREYLFDKNAHIRYEWLSDYMEREFSSIYTNKRKSLSTVTKNINKLGKEFKRVYYKLYYNNICSYAKHFFDEVITDKSKTCDSISGNTSRYGLSVLLPFFIDELKEIKLEFEQNEEEAKKYGYSYNYTLYGLPQFNQSMDLSDEEKVKMYKKYDPIRLLSSEKHDSALIIFKYLLKDIFDEMNSCLINTNESEQMLLRNINNSTLFGYFCICVIMYFVVWLKIENTVYSTIFKAKNMLMILPKEILIGLDSVYKLFDINNSVNDDDDEENETG